jgi:hypothetical protein
VQTGDRGSVAGPGSCDGAEAVSVVLKESTFGARPKESLPVLVEGKNCRVFQAGFGAVILKGPVLGVQGNRTQQTHGNNNKWP